MGGVISVFVSVISGAFIGAGSGVGSDFGSEKGSDFGRFERSGSSSGVGSKVGGVYVFGVGRLVVFTLSLLGSTFGVGGVELLGVGVRDGGLGKLPRSSFIV